MKRALFVVAMLFTACSSQDDAALPASGDAGTFGAAPSSPTPPASSSSSSPSSPTQGCAALPAPTDAPAAPALDVYPSPRFVSASPTLGATAKTACVDTSALASHARLDGLVPSIVAEAGLAIDKAGSCTCDWSLTFATQPPALDAAGKAALTQAGAAPDRFVVATSVSSGRNATTLFAGSEAGAMYALRAALASSHKDASGTIRASTATLVDWPDVARRGVVEGIYGPSNPGAVDCGQSNAYYLPYRVEDRTRLIRLLARARLNSFMYGPKCDPFSGPSAWDQLYPTGGAQVIATAAHEADANLVDFIYAIRPLSFYQRGGTYAQELAALTGKLDQIRGLGVRHFALFWDDSYDYPGTVADQIRVINDVDTYVKSKDPKDRLTVVGQPYCGNTDSFCDGPNALTDAWGNGLHHDIAIFWTGTGVEPTTMTGGQMTAINASYKRKVTIWDNWPCSGGAACGGPGFRGRSADLPGAIDGYFTNPVLNEYPGPALPTQRLFEVIGPIADWAWNAKGYVGKEGASYTRWQPTLAALEPKIGGACTPCGAYGDYWTCSKTTMNAIEFCDPVTHCLNTFACAKGCETKPNPNPDVCHF